MALNAANARVALTGAISVAPTGTAAPTDASTALPAAWKDLGYVTEDGVTETRDRSTDTLRAWQNADLLREVVTEADLTFQFTLAETKAETVALYYGSTVDTATGAVVIVPAATGGRQSFVIDVVDGTQLIRAYIPEGEITEVGDQVLSHGEIVGYDVTIKAYPSAALAVAGVGNGAAKKWYSGLKTTTTEATEADTENAAPLSTAKADTAA